MPRPSDPAPLSRRAFAVRCIAAGATAAAAGLGAACAPALAATAPSPTPGGARARPLGLQLYTVRDLLRRDFDGTLAAVAAAGYAEVEFAGYHGHAPTEVRRLLERHGLVAPAAHVPWDRTERDWPAALAEALVH